MVNITNSGLNVKYGKYLTMFKKNKMTSLAPISSENPSSVVQQNQRIRHSCVQVQCKKSSTDGLRCQEAKEDRQF